jgi:hypothetical protein
MIFAGGKTLYTKTTHVLEVGKGCGEQEVDRTLE